MSPGTVKISLAALLVLSLTCPASPEEQIRTFTNEDLEKYHSAPPTERETLDRSTHANTLPSSGPRDAAAILKENERAIVAVGAFDGNGILYNHGSGVVLSGDGAVVTSYHVVHNAADIRIKAGDTVHNVTGIIYADAENDIAILRAEGSGLEQVRLGSLNRVSSGEKVYVIANPRGEGVTVSEGVLAEIREVAGKGTMLQITAAFGAGQSGSPVFNDRGEVIGIATFLVKDPQGPAAAQNLHFAVPVDVVKDKVSSASIAPLKVLRSRDFRETADYWISSGNELVNSGKYREAADAYEKALAIGPSNADALNGLGVAYMKLKKQREAIEIFKEALAGESKTAWTYSNLGLAYIEAGMYREAIDPLKHALSIMPDLEAAHYNLGIAYKNLGMPKEAVSSFKNAISIYPGSADAHFGLGLEYVIMKDRDSALKEYTILKTLDRQRADMLLNMIKQ